MLRDAGLIIGLTLSLALHATMGAAFVWWLSPTDAQHRHRPAMSDAQTPPVVRPGIETSDASVDAWIGASSATPHSGAAANVDQTGFTMNPGTADRSSPRALPLPPLLPTPAISAEEALREMARRARTVGLLGPPPASPVMPAAQSSAGATASEPAQPGRPGIASDRESDAASTTHAIEVSPGEVLAARGLEIKTRRPKWNQTSIVTRTPRNPTIRVTFRSDGTVQSADFVWDGPKRLDTGYEEIDAPLLNAVHAWTATGKPLRDLPSPESVITMTFYINLRG